MRAVNLIPLEQRRGGAGMPGRSGAAVYVFLGALAALVVMVCAYVVVGNTVKDRRAELAQVTQDNTTAQAQAAALKPYADFASLRQTRLQTVDSLARSRFDWDRAMRQLARVLPADVWLTSLTGTVATGVSFGSSGGGSGGDTASIRSALNVPAIELVGCVPTQADVARVMARLRQMEGVQRVSLAASEKNQNSAGAGGDSAGGSGGSSDTDCRHGSPNFPKFAIVIFFDAPTAPSVAGSAGAPPVSGTPPAATATASSSSTPAPASSSAPAPAPAPASSGAAQ
jgi:Tfp pilus assembly protein PilN